MRAMVHHFDHNLIFPSSPPVAMVLPSGEYARHRRPCSVRSKSLPRLRQRARLTLERGVSRPAPKPSFTDPNHAQGGHSHRLRKERQDKDNPVVPRRHSRGCRIQNLLMWRISFQRSFSAMTFCSFSRVCWNPSMGRSSRRSVHARLVLLGGVIHSSLRVSMSHSGSWSPTSHWVLFVLDNRTACLVLHYVLQVQKVSQSKVAN